MNFFFTAIVASLAISAAVPAPAPQGLNLLGLLDTTVTDVLDNITATITDLETAAEAASNLFGT